MWFMPSRWFYLVLLLDWRTWVKFGLVLVLAGGWAFLAVQTSAQAPQEPTRADRLLQAEERQADALEALVREMHNTNNRLRDIERRCR